MKKTVFVVVLLLTISLRINAQWYSIITPNTNNLNAVHFVDKNTGWICGDNGLILFTKNRGIDWVEQASGTFETLKDIKFFSKHIGWAVGVNGVIVHTSNGGITWGIQVSGVGSQLNEISVIDSNIVKVVGNLGKELHTSNGGITWYEQTILPDYMNIYTIFFITPNTGWLGAVSNQPPFGPHYAIYKTVNSGNSWQVQNGAGGAVNDIFFVNEIYGWVSGFSSCIMVSTNGGDDWFYKGFSDGTHYSYRLFLLDTNIGWITNYWESNAIRFTSDGGNTWSIQAQAASRFSGINFVEQKYGCAVGMAGLILQTDNGGGVFPTTPILFSPENNQQLISDTVNLVWSSATPQITGYEVYLSTESLFSNTIDTLITDTTIIFTNLEINTKYYWKVKAKNEIGSGDESVIFSFKTSVTDVEETKVLPIAFSLSQNYPNPFNPSTSIQYAISSRQFVTLKVYDLLGKGVATLVNEEKPAGSYNVDFNASNLASGIYYYQLRGGDFIETKKMILMK